MYKLSFFAENNLKKLEPTITQTINTANMSPRYCDVDCSAFSTVPAFSASDSWIVFNAGVHMKTNVYIAPSKQDCPMPKAAILESLIIKLNPFDNEDVRERFDC